MSSDDSVIHFVNRHEKNLTEVAQAIWDNPEVALHEFFAAKLLSGELEQAGFRVEMGVGQMPTAFVASWGSGTPIIGILAEYDALPGLSQAVSATQQPIKADNPGHGCGHNLYGAGSLGAALAVKEAMEKDNIQGTVRLYGCPAEETLVGKVFMAKEGVFDDLSAALAWHPGYGNSSGGNCSSLALNSFKVNFHGTASHAGAAPHLGRSALDGVMLMDVGVNYLREHVEPEVRLHCIVTHGGGAPNIVPPYAQVWYYVRAPRREQVEQIYARVLDIAQGAALMSGTSYDIDFLTGGYEVLPNLSIDGIINKKMVEIGAPRFLEEDLAFARQLQKSISPQVIEMNIQQMLQMSGKGVTREDLGDLLCTKIIPPLEEFKVMPGSTDVGDVSQITPTGSLNTCCEPLGTPPHSWQVVAAAGSGIGARGMLTAAKALAVTAVELLTSPETLQAAHKEFMDRTGGKKYVSPLPEGARPH